MAYRAMWFNAGMASDWKPGDPAPVGTMTVGPYTITEAGYLGFHRDTPTTLEEARRRLLTYFDTVGAWAAGPPEPLRLAMLRVGLQHLEPGQHIRTEHLVYWIEDADDPLP